MARDRHSDDNNYFRITFEDGSRVVWGWRPHGIRGDHMARFFAEAREEAEAMADNRPPRKIKAFEPV